MDINTCFATTESYHTIAYYSHLVPVFITFVLIFFVLTKSKFSFLSKVFASFGFSFSLWFIGDVIVWTSSNYNLVSAVWAPLDYINIVFYLLGAYFLAILVKDADLSFWQKTPFVLLTLPAWWFTFSNQSISLFYQPVCEAFNSDFLTNYKLIVEGIVIVFIIIVTIFSLIKKIQKRKQTVLVASALILFFATFSVTEYISSQSGIYEINLYSLFILPVFLFMIIYSITNLQMFQLRLMSTQILAYTMIIMVGSQFFFLENTTDQTLTVVTFVISLAFGVLLARDAKKEAQQREQIEKLASNLEKANDRLKVLDQQKSEFISLASHQLRGPLTAIKGYTSLILEGDCGPISNEIKDNVQTIYKSTEALVILVNDYLDVSRIEQGRMKYDFSDFDLKTLVETVINEMTPTIKLANLNISFEVNALENHMVHADQGKIKQVITNLIDNAVKYTKVGNIHLTLKRDVNKKKLLISIKDTGVGIPSEVLPRLFEKFTRAQDANKTNIMGTGLGLYVAKKMIEAHQGRVWAESEGKGKGSSFFIELDTLDAYNSKHVSPQVEQFAKDL